MPEPGSSDIDVQAPTEFEAWLRPHLHATYKMAVAAVGPPQAEDLMQEVLTRAWQKFDSYDPQRGSAATWLQAITRDRVRQRARRTRATSQLPAAFSSADESSHAFPVDIDLRRAVNLLKPKQRKTVFLHYYADFTISEIASILECAEGTVKSNLSDARRNLRTRLEQPEHGRQH